MKKINKITMFTAVAITVASVCTNGIMYAIDNPAEKEITGNNNRYYGEMRVVEITVAIRNRWSNNMRKYMENHITIVPSYFCSKCTGEDDISFLDVAFNVLEKDIYIVKKI